MTYPDQVRAYCQEPLQRAHIETAARSLACGLDASAFAHRRVIEQALAAVGESWSDLHRRAAEIRRAPPAFMLTT